MKQYLVAYTNVADGRLRFHSRVVERRVLANNLDVESVRLGLAHALKDPQAIIINWDYLPTAEYHPAVEGPYPYHISFHAVMPEGDRAGAITLVAESALHTEDRVRDYEEQIREQLDALEVTLLSCKPLKTIIKW